MARDQQLLERAIAGEGPLLRIYGWARPTLSLGYFQKLEDVAADTAGIDVVSRFTGGGAILHDRELTFAIALPPAHPWARLGVNESYLEITRPLLDLLKAAGVPASFRGGDSPESKAANCFAGSACPDVVVKGRKLFGSAQRRRNGAVLQHGSLLLSIDQALWTRVFGPQLGQGFIALDEAVPGAGVSPESLLAAYEKALGQSLKSEAA
jgi:lipoate-protein ligase A